MCSVVKKPLSITVEPINYELDPALTEMVTNESLGERTKALTLLQSKLDKISISKVYLKSVSLVLNLQ